MSLSLTSHSPRRPPILRHVRHRSAMWTGHRRGSAPVRHLHRRARWRPRNRECTCRLTRTAINSFSLNSVGSCPLVICTPRCHTSRHASQCHLGCSLLSTGCHFGRLPSREGQREDVRVGGRSSCVLGGGLCPLDGLARLASLALGLGEDAMGGGRSNCVLALRGTDRARY